MANSLDPDETLVFEFFMTFTVYELDTDTQQSSLQLLHFLQTDKDT